jgi:hypothetical protein
MISWCCILLVWDFDGSPEYDRESLLMLLRSTFTLFAPNFVLVGFSTCPIDIERAFFFTQTCELVNDF